MTVCGRSRPPAGRTAGQSVAWRFAARVSLAALPVVLTCCARPGPDPVAVALDRSVGPVPSSATSIKIADYGGYYAGLWTPAPDGSCAKLAAIPRDLLVDPAGATSGVNFPMRGFVSPDGAASLSYGKAALIGRFGPDGFAGRANSGDGCSWLVTMTRQPPIGGSPGQAPPPGTDLVRGEVSHLSARQTLQPERSLGQ